MAKFEIDTEFVRKLAQLLQETDLGEIELADGEQAHPRGAAGRDGGSHRWPRPVAAAAAAAAVRRPRRPPMPISASIPAP